MAEDTRDRILQACARTIARAGLHRFRMQDVAREAGVSIGLLSYHFGDREGLLQAALDHVNASTAARADLAAQPGSEDQSTTAAERLSLLLCSEFGDETGIREGSIAWNELRAVAVFEAPSAAALARSTADWQASVHSLIAEADPTLGAQRAAHLALILTSLVEGLSGRWLTGQLTAADAQAAVRDALVGLGIAAPHRPGTRTSGR